MNGGNLKIVITIVVHYRKQTEIPHHFRRQELTDEALVFKFAHGEMQRLQPVGAGDVREPVAIFLSWRLTDALDVLEHGKAQRIRVDTVIPLAVIRRLIHHVGMAVQELHHEAFRHFALIVQVIQDGVVPEGRPAFIHHLGLFLRVKILADFTHNAQHFTLPRLQQWRVLFHKVQQVFLRLRGIARRLDLSKLFLFAWQGAPQRIDLALQILFPAFLPRFLFLQRNLLRAFIAIDAIVHQRMTGIQQPLDLLHAITLFAIRDVVTREQQVIDN